MINHKQYEFDNTYAGMKNKYRNKLRQQKIKHNHRKPVSRSEQN